MEPKKNILRLKNKVICIAKKIENSFWYLENDGVQKKTKEIFVEILNLINDIILENNDEEPKKWWEFKIQCNSDDILFIKKQLEILELNYELTSKD